MNWWQNLKTAYKNATQRINIKAILRSPIAHIIGINTAMFVLWRVKGVPQQFLVNHFTFERFNVRENRFHTMLTYAFSHFGFISYLFNMVIIGSFGKAIQTQFGGKIIWLLYIAGAVMGAGTMYLGMPYVPMTIPQVGADACSTAMVTFYGLFNMHQSVVFFFFPVKMWVLLGLLGLYCIYQPSKRNLGGAFAGLFLYQMFKFRII